MAKNNTDTSAQLITNLPSNGGGTGDGILMTPSSDIGGSIKPPKYQKDPLTQTLKDNWHIVLFFFGAISFLYFQVLAPLGELKQRVGSLEKTTDRNSNWIDEIIKNSYLNKQQTEPVISSPSPTIVVPQPKLNN